jgi:hypothetical protein
MVVQKQIPCCLYLNKIFLDRCARNHIKEKAKRLLIIFKREKYLNAFLKVNMTNHIQLVTVATVLLCELH